MNLYVIVAIILGSFAAGGATSWKVQNWRHDSMEKQRIEQESKEQGIRAQRVGTAAEAHEADKEKLRTQFVTITQTVEKIIEKPVYRDMCFDADGLRALGDAIQGGTTGGESAAAMPRSPASR